MSPAERAHPSSSHSPSATTSGPPSAGSISPSSPSATPASSTAEAFRRFCFRPEQRLQHALQFRAVFDAKCAKPAHPLIVHGRPNDVGFTRLGLSVNRRIGTAVERNRIKRLIREAFRLLQYDLPAGYDIVVVARRPSRDGPTFEIERSKELLLAAATQIDREWQRRRSSSGHHRRRRPRT